jgi:hypothetical protein|tara:strand:- start:313 stop:489 length:177 start_codon:yes stop_codon:yes gene_type:complete
MNPLAFKSVAINIEHYKLLKELSNDRFELPISMSKTCEFLIKKSYDELQKKKNGKSKK